MDSLHSLVSSEDVAAHLRLLGAIRAFFHSLSKDHIQASGEVFRPSFDGELFLCRSVHRFKSWILNILRPTFLSVGPDQGLQECELPPFDVIVLLHSYMLHPRSFYEDTIRVYPELAILKGFPLLQVVRLIPLSVPREISLSQLTSRPLTSMNRWITSPM